MANPAHQAFFHVREAIQSSEFSDQCCEKQERKTVRESFRTL
jgi:hypothetical protein